MQRLPAVVGLRRSQTTTTYVRGWLTSLHFSTKRSAG
jgi:hypothetical protein